MESREAPLDLYKVQPYSFTINVSPKKRIQNYNWGQLSNSSQKDLLLSVMSNSLHNINKSSSDISYEFEQTQAGHIHVHGLIQCTNDEIKTFQTLVCNKLAFPKLDKSICFKYIKTIIDPNFWTQYMNKTIQMIELDQDGQQSPHYNLFIHSNAPPLGETERGDISY